METQQKDRITKTREESEKKWNRNNTTPYSHAEELDTVFDSRIFSKGSNFCTYGHGMQALSKVKCPIQQPGLY